MLTLGTTTTTRNASCYGRSLGQRILRRMRTSSSLSSSSRGKRSSSFAATGTSGTIRPSTLHPLSTRDDSTTATTTITGATPLSSSVKLAVPAVNIPLNDRLWRSQSSSQSRLPSQPSQQHKPLSQPQNRYKSAVAATSSDVDTSPPSTAAGAGAGAASPQDHPHGLQEEVRFRNINNDRHDGHVHHPEVDPEFLREVGILNRDQLLSLASRKPTPLRLADMYKYGRNSSDLKHRLRNAQFLHREMPIRIAQRAVDLLTLPHGLSEAKPIRQVAAIYLKYLKELLATPCPKTKEEEDAFTDLLQGFVLDRTSVPEAIALGVSAWREHHLNQLQQQEEQQPEMEHRLQEMEGALYRFFTARVGLRFITEHHVLSSRRPECQALRKVTHMFPEDYDNSNSDEYELGCIQSNCNLVEETRKVADLVMQQTTAFYGFCPPIEIVDCQQQQHHQGCHSNHNNITSNNNNNFTYVTHHLHYMLAELLKNACRATIEQYLSEDLLQGGKDDSYRISDGKCEKENANDKNNSNNNNSSNIHASTSLFTAELHPIRVILTKGDEDVTVKIADKGGGIPRSWMNHLWKFGSHHSQTADFGTIEGGAEDGGKGVRLMRGFGLPLARIYARYFGGELNLKSMEGYGVDAYLHLPRLGSSCENLPLRVRASPGERDSTPGRQYVRSYTTSATAATSSSSSSSWSNTSAATGSSFPGRMCYKKSLRLPYQEVDVNPPLDENERKILDELLSRAL